MDQALDLNLQAPVLHLVPTSIWFYDASACRNVWGNRAAHALSGAGSDEAFTQEQRPPSTTGETPQEDGAWEACNQRLLVEVQKGGHELELASLAGQPLPGFLAGVPGPRQARFSRVALIQGGQEAHVVMVQAVTSAPAASCSTDCAAEVRAQPATTSSAPGPSEAPVLHPSLSWSTQQRMVDMCDNHRMFQFLFDEQGRLLAANRRAIQNMTEHLGEQLSREDYTLRMYLGIGECDGGLTPDQLYKQAMDAIFVDKLPCYRIPMLRWSKRYQGKYRWVLYEMWPLQDPVTHQPAVLVTEQNISQVKAVEEQFREQTRKLEAQLEEALQAPRDPLQASSLIDIDTPADKTLKLLDKIMRGHDVSPCEAQELRETITKAQNLCEPINLNEQLMSTSRGAYDTDVSESLLQLLGSRRRNGTGENETDASSSPIPPSSMMKVVSRPPSATPMVDTADIMRLCKQPSDEVSAVLAQADAWQFDAFELDRVSMGKPLSMLGFYLMQRAKIISKFDLDEVKLVRFLMRMEDGYPITNPYHNRCHAADVLQSLHVLVTRGGLQANGFCPDGSLLACYLSAIMHDYEHKGVNNDFLVRVSDSLAILYNDKSPMENHHLAAAFQLLAQDEFNFWRQLPHKAREALRKQMIDMVLATDMKQHFSIHSMFQTKFIGPRGSGTLSGSNQSARERLSRSNSEKADKMSGESVSGKLQTTPPIREGDDMMRKVVDDDTRSLALQVALKCADLGHLASPRLVHQHWVQLLEEEFFRQGDREAQSSLQVSPLMDRHRNGITKSQVGFFDIVAMPLFQSFTAVFGEALPILEAVRDNYLMWKEDLHVHPSRV